jgi:hypothetical protein
MKTRQRLIAYAVLNATFFAFGVHVLKIRELGLYFFTVAVGAPASFAVVPLSERIAPSLGWHLGSLKHVWVANCFSAVANIFVAWVLVLVARRVRGR